jgi:DNA-binding transcriptional ArsR family regulator/soluble cytochrome b562
MIVLTTASDVLSTLKTFWKNPLLSTTTRDVLTGLLLATDRETSATFIRAGTLATRLGLHLRTVRRAIRELVDMGILTIRKERRSTKTRSTNVYAFGRDAWPQATQMSGPKSPFSPSPPSSDRKIINRSLLKPKPSPLGERVQKDPFADQTRRDVTEVLEHWRATLMPSLCGKLETRDRTRVVTDMLFDGGFSVRELKWAIDAAKADRFWSDRDYTFRRHLDQLFKHVDRVSELAHAGKELHERRARRHQVPLEEREAKNGGPPLPGLSKAQCAPTSYEGKVDAMQTAADLDRIFGSGFAMTG